VVCSFILLLWARMLHFLDGLFGLTICYFMLYLICCRFFLATRQIFWRDYVIN
jgi:hypothetical protein